MKTYTYSYIFFVGLHRVIAWDHCQMSVATFKVLTNLLFCLCKLWSNVNIWLIFSRNPGNRGTCFYKMLGPNGLRCMTKITSTNCQKSLAMCATHQHDKTTTNTNWPVIIQHLWLRLVIEWEVEALWLDAWSRLCHGPWSRAVIQQVLRVLYGQLQVREPAGALTPTSITRQCYCFNRCHS